MPSLLSLPRELRDLIYKAVLDGPTEVSSRGARIRFRNKTGPPPLVLPLQAPPFDLLVDPPSRPSAATLATRSVVTIPEEESEYPEGDAAIRYPTATVQPPTTSMLATSQQLRGEASETLGRQPVHYQIRLAMRNGDILYPTWISVPRFSKHIDLLDAYLRVRSRKTASLFSSASTVESLHNRDSSDALFGGMVLLRRFLERGVSFIGQRKGMDPDTTIGRLALHFITKDFETLSDSPPPSDLHDLLFSSVVEIVYDLFVGKGRSVSREAFDHRDEFIRFFAQRVGCFEILVGDSRKEWIMKDVVKEMDRGNVDGSKEPRYLYI